MLTHASACSLQEWGTRMCYAGRGRVGSSMCGLRSHAPSPPHQPRTGERQHTHVRSSDMVVNRPAPMARASATMACSTWASNAAGGTGGAVPDSGDCRNLKQRRGGGGSGGEANGGCDHSGKSGVDRAPPPLAAATMAGTREKHGMPSTCARVNASLEHSRWTGRVECSGLGGGAPDLLHSLPASGPRSDRHTCAR